VIVEISPKEGEIPKELKDVLKRNDYK